MKCEELPIIAYIEEMLTPEETAEVETHILECKACRETLDEWKREMKRMSLFWPRPDSCPGSFELTSFLFGFMKNQTRRDQIEKHISRCKICSNIHSTYQQYQKNPDDRSDDKISEPSEAFKRMLEEYRSKRQK